MNKENILKYLVPVVAVIVLIESVMLLSNLSAKKESKVVTEPTLVTETNNPVAEKAVFNFELATPMTSLTVGEKGMVTVTMNSLSDKSVDSVNVYVKYDPKKLDITKLEFGNKLPVPTFSKVSETKGMVVANFLIAEPAGLSFVSNEKVEVMTFEISPKLAGEINLEISTGNEAKESATMIVENATSKVLPFGSNKLTVNAN